MTEQRHVIGEFDYQGSDEHDSSSSSEENGGNLKKALRKFLNEQDMTWEQAGRLSGTSKSSINNALLGKSMWKRTEKKLWDFIKERSQSDSEETPTQRRIRIGTENFRKANLKRIEEARKRKEAHEGGESGFRPFVPPVKNDQVELFRALLSVVDRIPDLDEDRKHQMLGKIAATLFSHPTHE